LRIHTISLPSFLHYILVLLTTTVVYFHHWNRQCFLILLCIVQSQVEHTSSIVIFIPRNGTFLLCCLSTARCSNFSFRRKEQQVNLLVWIPSHFLSLQWNIKFDWSYYPPCLFCFKNFDIDFLIYLSLHSAVLEK
jgi:signal transduction histidine kinase